MLGMSPRSEAVRNALYPGSSKQAPEEEESQSKWRQQDEASSSSSSPTGGGEKAAVRDRPRAPHDAAPSSGLPPAKQRQQEEGYAPLDAEERDALNRRLANRGAGSYATARPGMRQTYGGVGSTLGSSRVGFAADAQPSGRGYGFGHAGYSARGVPAAPLSPSRQRAQVLTARREAERKQQLHQERARREKARLASLRAGALASARMDEAEQRREEARRALQARAEFNEERKYLATQSARKVQMPKMNVAKAMAAAPTDKQLRAKKLKNRPEWGKGHAGGARMKKDLRPMAHPWRGGEGDAGGGGMAIRV